jgi:hypothetical protein
VRRSLKKPLRKFVFGEKIVEPYRTELFESKGRSFHPTEWFCDKTEWFCTNTIQFYHKTIQLDGKILRLGLNSKKIKSFWNLMN